MKDQMAWRQILDWKCSFPRNGWDLQDACKMSLEIWKGILSIKKPLMENTKYQAGSRERILLWKTSGLEIGHWPLSFRTSSTVPWTRKLRLINS